jgi:hypothetical protein
MMESIPINNGTWSLFQIFSENYLFKQKAINNLSSKKPRKYPFYYYITQVRNSEIFYKLQTAFNKILFEEHTGICQVLTWFDSRNCSLLCGMRVLEGV